MLDSTLGPKIARLEKEIGLSIVAIDEELAQTKPSLKLLIPQDEATKKLTLSGNRDVLLFLQTLIQKMFNESSTDNNAESVKTFKTQLEKSAEIIEENLKNVKSLHPALGVPDLTNDQYAQMLGRKEMFLHFKNTLKDFDL